MLAVSCFVRKIYTSLLSLLYHRFTNFLNGKGLLERNRVNATGSARFIVRQYNYFVWPRELREETEGTCESVVEEVENRVGVPQWAAGGLPVCLPNNRRLDLAAVKTTSNNRPFFHAAEWKDESTLTSTPSIERSFGVNRYRLFYDITNHRSTCWLIGNTCFVAITENIDTWVWRRHFKLRRWDHLSLNHHQGIRRLLDHANAARLTPITPTRARVILSRLVSSSSFLFRFCRQCASRYKYIRAREAARNIATVATCEAELRGSLSLRSFLALSLPTARVSLCPAFVFVPLAFASRLLRPSRARPGRNIPGRHFSRRNAESLRSRSVTIETPEMFCTGSTHAPGKILPSGIRDRLASFREVEVSRAR